MRDVLIVIAVGAGVVGVVWLLGRRRGQDHPLSQLACALSGNAAGCEQLGEVAREVTGQSAELAGSATRTVAGSPVGSAIRRGLGALGIGGGEAPFDCERPDHQQRWPTNRFPPAMIAELRKQRCA